MNLTLLPGQIMETPTAKITAMLVFIQRAFKAIFDID
jgi:hypothetical protein